MPLIEELPISQSHRITHGWAYVPDTGAPLAALQPGNRKRGRDGATAAATANATAKQQKAVQLRLDALDKENYKDGVAVPIPQRSGGERGKRDKKMTQNVRRILTYQRAFAHYLADEEANAAAGGAQNSVTQSQTTTGRADARRKSAITTSTNTTAVDTPTQPTAPKRGRPPTKNKDKGKEKEVKAPPPTPPVKQEEKDNDIDMDDAPTTSTPSIPSKPTVQVKPAYDPKLDSHPLLRTTGLPKMPSDRVMALLVAEPPLSYTAAKAKHSDDTNGIPVRKFCAICGYWGKVKCRKCGEWTCGIMECWRGHEGVCVAQGMF